MLRAYLLCTSHGLPLLTSVGELRSAGGGHEDPGFLMSDKKFWQSTAQYVVVASGFFQRRGHFITTWHGLDCTVYCQSVDDQKLYHVYLSQRENPNMQTGSKFSKLLLPLLAAKKLHTSTQDSLSNFLSEVSQIIDNRTNESNFTNSVGNDELGSWWESYLENHPMSNSLRQFENSFISSLLVLDQDKQVNEALSQFIKATQATADEVIQQKLSCVSKILIRTSNITLSLEEIYSVDIFQNAYKNRLCKLNEEVLAEYVHLLEQKTKEDTEKKNISIVTDNAYLIFILNISESIVSILAFSWQSDQDREYLFDTVIKSQELKRVLKEYCYDAVQGVASLNKYPIRDAVYENIVTHLSHIYNAIEQVLL